MIIKAIDYKVADVDTGKRIVKAYFSIFGNVDLDGDTIHKGAFTKTIKEMGPKGKDMVRHFLNHDNKALPIGRVLELSEDSRGAYFVSKIASTTMASDVYALYQDSLIPGHSMGFMPVKYAYNETGMDIYEAKLFEVSTVTSWPANPEAQTIEVKAAGNPTAKRDKSLLIEPSRFTQKQIADMNTIYSLLKIN